MRSTACLGAAVAVAAAAFFAAAPTPADACACDYMVMEHTSQRVLGPAVMTPCGVPVALPYPDHYAQVAPAAPTCSCGKKAAPTCPCGGSKEDGTCTCGKKASTCPCGGSKEDGTCTCGKKKACSRNNQSEMKDLAEEGIHTFFKVMRGGMKMVEHLTDHISKKTAQMKPCGPPAPCGLPCGCGCAVKKTCGCGPAPCGCGCAKPCGCGCGGCGCGCRR